MVGNAAWILMIFDDGLSEIWHDMAQKARACVLDC